MKSNRKIIALGMMFLGVCFNTHGRINTLRTALAVKSHNTDYRTMVSKHFTLPPCSRNGLPPCSRIDSWSSLPPCS